MPNAKCGTRGRSRHHLTPNCRCSGLGGRGRGWRGALAPWRVLPASSFSASALRDRPTDPEGGGEHLHPTGRNTQFGRKTTGKGGGGGDAPSTSDGVDSWKMLLS